MISPRRTAIDLFAPIAPSYERWARILSIGQDPRWRQALVAGVDIPPGSLALDVAAGTGAISRLLNARGHRVVALDQSQEMLGELDHPGIVRVQSSAEDLPFSDRQFDVLTFGYLLRYVDDLGSAVGELSRVLRPGGTLAMLEFGRPEGVWGPLWWLYTRPVLGLAGRLVGRGWAEVGSFLGMNIDEFWQAHTPESLAGIWSDEGLEDVHWRHMSLGGGFLMWGLKS